MKKSDKGLLFISSALVLVIIISVAFMFKGVRRTAVQVVDELIYEMPRPKFFSKDFDLSGRTLERVYKALPSKKVADTPNTLKPGIPPKPVTPAAMKNTAAATQKLASPSPAQNQRPRVVVSVGDTGRTVELSNSASSKNTASTDYSPTPLEALPISAETIARVKEKDRTKKKNPNALSAQEWRDLLMSNPTLENVRKMNNALASEDIDAETYFQVTQSLITKPEQAHQFAGIYALENIPSLRSFVLLSKSYEQLSEGNQKIADEQFLTYAEPSRLGVLASALQSHDNLVVIKAEQALSYGVQFARNQTPIKRNNTGRGVRAENTTTHSDKYLTFIPILKSLSNESSSNIAGMATKLIGQIEALPTSTPTTTAAVL